MRLPGTIKKGTGQAYESYTITYTAQGVDEIRKSVQEVFEQISLTPFTVAEGGPFGTIGSEDSDIKHQAIAIRNFSVSTVPGLPNALQVQISFDPFNWQYYISPSDDDQFPVNHFDDAVCWPLVKIWAKTAQKSNYSGRDFNGKFGLYFPSDSGTSLIDALYNLTSTVQPSLDVSALDSFGTLLSGQRGAGKDLSLIHI